MIKEYDMDPEDFIEYFDLWELDDLEEKDVDNQDDDEDDDEDDENEYDDEEDDDDEDEDERSEVDEYDENYYFEEIIFRRFGIDVETMKHSSNYRRCEILHQHHNLKYEDFKDYFRICDAVNLWQDPDSNEFGSLFELLKC